MIYTCHSLPSTRNIHLNHTKQTSNENSNQDTLSLNRKSASRSTLASMKKTKQASTKKKTKQPTPSTKKKSPASSKTPTHTKPNSPSLTLPVTKKRKVDEASKTVAGESEHDIFTSLVAETFKKHRTEEFILEDFIEAIQPRKFEFTVFQGLTRLEQEDKVMMSGGVVYKV